MGVVGLINGVFQGKKVVIRFWCNGRRVEHVPTASDCTACDFEIEQYATISTDMEHISKINEDHMQSGERTAQIGEVGR